MRRAAASWAAWWVMALTVPGAAQSPGRRLHREIPGDLNLDAMPSGILASPQSPERLAAAAGRNHYNEAERPSGEPIAPRENWASVAATREMDRATQSDPGTELHYEEVFNPSVAPFKRTHAYDAVDDLGRLVVRDPSLRPVIVDAPPAWGGAPSARFTGDVLVELSPTAPTPIPSVAGEQRVVSFRTVPETPLAFFEDSAGNSFVRAPVTQALRVQLVYVLEAPQRAFTMAGIPGVLLSSDGAHRGMPAPVVPDFLRANVGEVLRRVGVSPTATMPAGLGALTGYFRAFRDGTLPDGLDGQLYRVLALGGVGACRHRAYAFVLTMHALGVNARFVGNEAHAWAEVALPGEGWSRIDLGGWNVPLRTESPTDREAFVPTNPDPLPRPPGYGQMYSATPSPGRAPAPTTTEEPTPGTTPPELAASAGANGPAGGAPTTSSEPGNATGAPDARNVAPGDGGVMMTAGAPDAGATGAAGERDGLRDDSSRDDRSAARTGTSLRVDAVRAADGSATTTFVRGTLVEVTGEAHDEGGGAAADLPVTFELWRGDRAVRIDRGAEPTTSLGTAVTGEDGRFAARVLLPVELNWGDYELRARTPGDARRLPSRSE